MSEGSSTELQSTAEEPPPTPEAPIGESSEEVAAPEPLETAEAEEIESVPPGEIEVCLTFEVGQLPISLRELETLAAGYCFELDRPAETPVVIRANGKAIGKGTLVDVDGRIGVQMTSTL